MSKKKCEIGHIFACNGSGVSKLTGVKKGDPVFWCCLGCQSYLRRMGVRTKPAPDKVKKPPTK